MLLAVKASNHRQHRCHPNSSAQEKKSFRGECATSAKCAKRWAEVHLVSWLGFCVQEVGHSARAGAGDSSCWPHLLHCNGEIVHSHRTDQSVVAGHVTC